MFLLFERLRVCLYAITLDLVYRACYSSFNATNYLEIQMIDYSHLDALELNLSHERARLNEATKKGEIELRTVWVKQLEKEIAGERNFLGLGESSEVSDDDLLAELGL